MGQRTDELAASLSAGTRTGKLGYVAGNGQPLVTPVWFVVEDGELLVRLRPTKVIADLDVTG
ncbi:hypothetical protein [Pseudonocardia asaccharolytica]|nr:hypothetical protein [Pseudonocardia asaccharolytica]